MDKPRISSLTRYLMVFLLCFGSCGDKEEPNPNAPTDKEGLTPAIRQILPDSVLQSMKAMGMPIYGGDNPGDLIGKYLAQPLVLVSSSRPEDSPGKLFIPLALDFTNQNNELLEIDVSYDQSTEQGQGIASYIVGNECQFTVFTPIEGINKGNPFKAIFVFSGTIASDGIEEFYLANFLLDDFGAPENTLLRIGEGRVIKDSDGLTLRQDIERRTFYSALPDCPCNFEEAQQLLATEKTSCPVGTWVNCGEASQTFHYGAVEEIRWTPDAEDAPGQQCTYDAAGGLITGGIAAGSPDKVSPSISCDSKLALFAELGAAFACDFNDHCIEDVQPWEKIPCWRYLTEWPANNVCQTDNVVSGIDHMRTLVGNMTCEEVTILLMAVNNASLTAIDINLRRYILGVTPNAFQDKSTLRALMSEWYTNESCANSSEDKCQVIQTAIDNLR